MPSRRRRFREDRKGLVGIPSQVRFVFGLGRVVLHLALGTFIIAIYFPFATSAARENLIGWWSRIVLRLFGMRLELSGRSGDIKGGTLIVLNHVSWIDIYVTHAVRPTRFVSKSEVRDWPLIGYLCEKTGTLFIERGKRRAVREVNDHVAQILRDGGVVGIFPEGTTSDGRDLLPFHANLIQAAIDAGVPIQPISLRYAKPDGALALDAAYIGEMSLIESVRLILLGAPILAQVTVLPLIETSGKTRQQVAFAARLAIATSLGVDTGDTGFVPDADLQDARQ